MGQGLERTVQSAELLMCHAHWQTPPCSRPNMMSPALLLDMFLMTYVLDRTDLGDSLGTQNAHRWVQTDVSRLEPLPPNYAVIIWY